MNNSALWIVLHRMRTPLLVLIVTYTIAIVGLLLIDGLDRAGNVYSMTIFDAFYVVTYTATTIGFGELPYPFTYAQKIWMSMIVYSTVLGWFYSIGTLVSLFQDKLLMAQLAEIRFRRQVKNIHQSFLIVLGYNYITSEIIKKANREGVRTIVIEKDINRINELHLENFTPVVPSLMADAYDPQALEKAGLNSKYCKAVVSLYKDDSLNLRVAITAKLLNKNVTLAVKSTTLSHTEDLLDLGVEIVENPFEIIADQIEMSIRNPHMLLLERWIYGIGTLKSKVFKLPKGKYVVCGYGRMGKMLDHVLSENGIEAIFIEPDKKVLRGLSSDIKRNIIIGSADGKENLIKAGIKDASAVIAITDDDTLNLSILASARKVNPNIVTIARENEMAGLSIFENAKINLTFIPSLVLIYKTTNALIAPYSNKFLSTLKENYNQGITKELVEKLISKIDTNPITFGITINEERSFALYQNLKKYNSLITLEIFSRSLVNRDNKNKILPLILIRDGKIFLLPSWDMEIKIDDKILFASDEEAMDDAQWICENKYEFHYAFKGRERKMFTELIVGKKI
ncbi:MAG: NAD-binding protein [Arcobacteraceae bacterium]|nr:NAD-binding protein [Arcobacteraceae bacterium]